MNERGDRLGPLVALLRCPACEAPLAGAGDGWLTCPHGHGFPVDGGLLRLLPPDPVDAEPITSRIQAFYEKNPFPDYEGFEDVATLMERAREGVFARLLDEQLPFGSRVLECGCGTGQLSNFLGIAHRTVVGTDLSLASLRLAEDFRARHGLRRVFFLQMNLFRPVFPDDSFDCVICNGVLHHTPDPRGGLRRLARLVRPGGHILIGLYHRYGRIPTHVRRTLYRVVGRRLLFLDPRFRRGSLGGGRGDAWFADQYRNPHESSHTIARTLDWLPECGLELVKTIPKTRLGAAFDADERLFEPDLQGGRLESWLCEAAELWRGSREGGFFTVIGRRR